MIEFDVFDIDAVEPILREAVRYQKMIGWDCLLIYAVNTALQNFSLFLVIRRDDRKASGITHQSLEEIVCISAHNDTTS